VAGICEHDHDPSALIKHGKVENVFHGAILSTVETEAQDISGLAVSSQNLMFVTDLS
jgi:hypothetical protein